MFIRGIKFKLSLFIMLLLLATTITFSVVVVRRTDDFVMGEALKKAQTVAHSTAAAAAYSLMANDLLGIDNLVAKMKQSQPDVDYIAIVDKDMRIMAHSDIQKRGQVFHPSWQSTLKMDSDGAVLNPEKGNTYEIIAPVTFLGKQLGYVVMGLNKKVPIIAQRKMRVSLIGGLLLALLLGLGGIFLVSQVITRPVKALASGISELKQGKKSRLKIYAKDEFGELTKSFNEMSALITDQKDRLANYAAELEEAYIATLRALAAAIDARDPYTLGHSTRVASLAVKLGQAVGMMKKELEEIEIACLLHDLGKLKTPDYILLKEGALDPGESREMKRHPEDGAEILARVPSLQRYIPAVKYHHEWHNGKGYPEGLKADQIPLSAAIIAIADAFDAMTSTRPYRQARSEAGALQELMRCAGSQFNPGLVELFIKVFKTEHEGYLISEVI
jgi:putative nucleotidyltransferase with HDIG domain